MNKIKVSTSVKASLQTVWEYWTNPKHITNWNFASDDWCCPVAENNLEPNGTFSWRMEAKDGSMGFDFKGIYDQIVENKLISYKMDDGRNVDIEFIQKENEVVVTETFDAEGTHSDEQQRAGWQAILENFRKYVEAES